MKSISQPLDREAAKLEPEAHFETPRALVDEPGLTLTEKISTLKIWSAQVDRRLASGYEGMPTHGTEPADAELLRNIGLALAQLTTDVHK